MTTGLLGWLRKPMTLLSHEHKRDDWLGWSLEFSTENESSARTIHRYRCRCGVSWSAVSAWDPPLEVMARQEAREAEWREAR